MDSDTYHSPEKIAWGLLVNNIDDSIQGIDTFPYEKDFGDQHAFIFEILITIFMELLFGMAKLDCLEKTEKYIPNYKTLPIDALLSVISDKMLILKYIVHVDEYDKSEFIDDKKKFKELSDKRYCRVLLRYYDNDDFFRKEISDDLYYHMKLNGLVSEKKYKKLSDVYSIIMLNEKIYVISFAKLALN
jgi:hypothetical protein